MLPDSVLNGKKCSERMYFYDSQDERHFELVVH